MATVYVQARPKGRPDGSPINDYVVEAVRAVARGRSRLRTAPHHEGIYFHPHPEEQRAALRLEG